MRPTGFSWAFHYVSIAVFILRLLAPNRHAGRDPDYLDINVKFTLDAMKTAAIINLFPAFMKP